MYAKEFNNATKVSYNKINTILEPLIWIINEYTKDIFAMAHYNTTDALGYGCVTKSTHARTTPIKHLFYFLFLRIPEASDRYR